MTPCRPTTGLSSWHLLGGSRCCSRQDDHCRLAQVALLLANRALVLLDQGLPSLALAQCDLALAHGYPGARRYKLLARKALCLARLGREGEAEQGWGQAEQEVREVGEEGREAALELVRRSRVEGRRGREECGEAEGGEEKGKSGVEKRGEVGGGLEEARLENPHPHYPAFSDKLEVSHQSGKPEYSLQYIALYSAVC